MKEAFADFKFQVGDLVRHKGRSISDVACGLIITRALCESRDAYGNPCYVRGYYICGYGIDANAEEMELELVVE